MTHESNIDALSESDIGCEVQTGDGTRLGQVKAVHGSYFEVDVPHEEDYWLAAHYVGSYEQGNIRLTLDRGEVDEHRVRAPATTTMTGEVGDTGILSEQEALEQRERMERQLLEQRGKMDTGLKWEKD